MYDDLRGSNQQSLPTVRRATVVLLVSAISCIWVHSVYGSQDERQEDSLSYSSARSYRAPTEEVWLVAQAIAEDWGLADQTVNQLGQAVVFGWKPFSDFENTSFFRRVPTFLMNGAETAPGEFKLHLFVSPFVQPSRVHVSSVVRSRRDGAAFLHYHLGFVGDEFLAELERRLGESGSHVSRREANSCRASALPPLQLTGSARLEPLIADSLYYPSASEALVVLDAIIWLDGSVSVSRVYPVAEAETTQTEEFVQAARDAVALWRYWPLEGDGCPISVTATIAISFGLDDAGRGLVYSGALVTGSAQAPEQPASVQAPVGTDPDRPVFRPSPGLVNPRPLEQVQPRYTRGAMARQIQGDVWLEIVVERDGRVGDVWITRSLDRKFGLDVEAVIALKQWRFEPATTGFGEAVAMIVGVSMAFNMED